MSVHKVNRETYGHNGMRPLGVDQVLHFREDGARGRPVRVSKPFVHFHVTRNPREQRGIKRCLFYI